MNSRLYEIKTTNSTGNAMKKLLLSLIFISTSIFAGEGSGTGKITELYVDAKGTIVRIKFSQPTKNPHSCQKAEFYMIELDGGPGSSRYLSALLTAYTAQKNVSFWIHGCTRGSYWGGTRPQLHDIYMH